MGGVSFWEGEKINTVQGNMEKDIVWCRESLPNTKLRLNIKVGNDGFNNLYFTYEKGKVW